MNIDDIDKALAALNSNCTFYISPEIYRLFLKHYSVDFSNFTTEDTFALKKGIRDAEIANDVLEALNSWGKQSTT